MSSFRECFEAYGANYDVTMERFMGNEALYLRLFGMLFADDNLQRLGDALAAGDITGAFEAAHTLKGVTGNLGLEPLYRAVCEIVEPLRSREERDYKSMHEEILAQFQRARELLDNLKEG
ncbi:MAG: Hpt domain-containing protein [Clostridiales bacterium]|uniref:Hpt domain-containing protein n=1 Tax=Harryflintia acetispora TaxID=1849041 RepID=A0A9X8UK96_9FIRM|nr:MULTISPECIES: Hpt domain-containing protein [Oscillospiraceae]PWM36212.1 MAG: Hpt domain-containing protein [Clostridiales bacterium]RGB69632.1 Hpt domain-containing protein [Harryflintia acetispora]TCL44466.1 Hpt domain-containing protein [Harryflintia acetispora]